MRFWTILKQLFDLLPSLPSRWSMRGTGGRSLLFSQLLGRSAPWFVGWLIRWLVGWLVGSSVGRLISWLVCWLVSWLVGCWLASLLSSWMASSLALLAQISWLRFDGLLGSLVCLLTLFELASPLLLIARIRIIFCFVRSFTSSVRLLA